MTPISIIKKVAKKYGLTLLSITGKSRSRWIKRARLEAYLKLLELGLSVPDVGRMFGKHHASVYHALGRNKKNPKI